MIIFCVSVIFVVCVEFVLYWKDANFNTASVIEYPFAHHVHSSITSVKK